MTVRVLECPASPLRPIAEAWLQEAHAEKFGLNLSVDRHLEDLTRMAALPNSDVLLLCNKDGVIGYMGLEIFKSPLGEEHIANEHYWFVLPSYRGRGSLELLNAAGKWAKEKGCTHMMLNASHLASDAHDSLERLYAHRGFEKFETTYLKEL